jgi:uncharacterized membrane protein (DUF106 family)
MNQIITFQISYIELALSLLFVAFLVALCFAIPAFYMAKDAQESVEELKEEQRDVEKRLKDLEAKKDEGKKI